MSDTDSSYEGVRRVVYQEGATFVPICSQCHRFVQADPTITLRDETIAAGPNAECRHCGRTEMVFEGFYGEGE